jgi:hypothetical protein
LINLSNGVEIQDTSKGSKSFKKKYFARVGAGNNGSMIKERLIKRGCWRIMDAKTWKKVYKKLKSKKSIQACSGDRETNAISDDNDDDEIEEIQDEDESPEPKKSKNSKIILPHFCWT